MTASLIIASGLPIAALAIALIAAATLVGAIRRPPFHSSACPVPGCGWAFTASNIGTLGNQVDDHLEAEHGRRRFGGPPRWQEPGSVTKRVL